MRMQPEHLAGGQAMGRRLALVPAGRHGAGRDKRGECPEFRVKRAGQHGIDVRLDADDRQRCRGRNRTCARPWPGRRNVAIQQGCGRSERVSRLIYTGSWTRRTLSELSLVDRPGPLAGDSGNACVDRDQRARPRCRGSATLLNAAPVLGGRAWGPQRISWRVRCMRWKADERGAAWRAGSRPLPSWPATRPGP